LLWFAFEISDKREGLYNVLWALVFAFATLNILGLLARRFESGRNRLSFGEITAILVVGLSVVLLGMEMLNLFKIFPIRLGNH
jgi:CHASE2 domain-containing sensor protein